MAAVHEDDAASELLADHAEIPEGAIVLHLNCGNGLFGLRAAAQGAGRVILSDRNVAAVASLEGAAAAAGATVVHGHGRIGLPPDVAGPADGAAAAADGVPAGATGRADVIGLRIPREKAALLQLLWDAFHLLRPGGRCYVAGPTNEGIKSAARLAAELFGSAEVVARAHSSRVVMSVKKSTVPTDASAFDTPYLDPENFFEYDATLRDHGVTLFSRPGVFSWDHLDEATATLAEVMQVSPGASVLDLGCGSGALGIVAARLSETGTVVMVDADFEAVRCAALGATAAGLTNASVLTSDVGGAVIDQCFDTVITNPPFHTGRATDLSLPARFIHDAWHVLSPGGTLQLVANRTLPYENMIRKQFGNLNIMHESARFKVVSATRGS